MLKRYNQTLRLIFGNRIRLLPVIKTKNICTYGCNGCKQLDNTPRINLNGEHCELELLPRIQQWVKELFLGVAGPGRKQLCSSRRERYVLGSEAEIRDTMSTYRARDRGGAASVP
ncbi:uncharacterized protein LOC113003232 [Solenopsis invicta]|uniref:uncharacterized protein LOC113003232 n=1 Tax=Solenopsis invicta TaxID=13686 RepID=UPI000E33F7AC|nr:uncharacterized protein LOC113003232 [Solenopsis invicta]